MSNYDMAHECIGTAEKAGTLPLAHIEAMAAQTYATLAIVDELRAQRQGIRDTVAEEVSDALMDARGSGDDAIYVIADSPQWAATRASDDEGYDTLEGAKRAYSRIAGTKHSHHIYRVSVEVVQP